MLLLTSNFFNNTYILAPNLSIFLKNVLKETRNTFITKSRCQWKDRKRSCEIREAPALSQKLTALNLG